MERTPQQPKSSTQKSLKTLHRKNNKGLSLKEFVRSQSLTDATVKTLAETWFFNKGANFAKSPLGLGSTRKKKGSKK